jgi:peptidase A4-like protein
MKKDFDLHLVRELKIPPFGFDVRTASERELQMYGLPRRPDAEKHPALARLWDSVARRQLKFVRPPLVPLRDRSRSRIHNFTKKDLSGSEYDTIRRRLDGIPIHIPLCWIWPNTSTNWSGAVVAQPSAAESLVTVTGQWTVPNVSPPLSAWNGTGFNDGTYICAVWVGLDGWNGTNDVLQSGTNSVVTVSDGQVTARSYYAWIEWYGNPWTPESDFPVEPGDSILCTVCAPFGNAHGTAMFTNHTTGLAMNYGIDPPPGVTLTGNVAEWIVEDPAQSSGSLYPFPNYGLTIFTNCGAGSKNVSLNLNSSCPVNLLSGSGTVISEATIESGTSLMCNFLS